MLSVNGESSLTENDSLDIVGASLTDEFVLSITGADLLSEPPPPPQAANVIINKDCVMIFVNEVREVFIDKVIVL
jgi:archaeosine-15-forming tRNA-guanine transglycosylase